MHTRAEKFIEIPELENWLDSGYDYGSILREKFQVKCADNGNAYSVELFMEMMRAFVQKRKQDKDVTEDIAQITVSDIVDYSLREDWFHGGANSITTGLQEENNANDCDISSLNGKDYILYHCCEELELLSREFSNDEGVDGPIAAGPQTIIDTEHPDYLRERGLAKSALRTVPMPKPDWDNPLPEHTPGLLQKAFIDVFKTGDADPYQERPRSIREPPTTWEVGYMEWLAKQPEAHTSLALNFWIHNRAMRISCRKNVQVALMCNKIDKSDLPTKGELMRDKAKREDLESKVLSMKSNVKDSDAFWQKVYQDLVGTERYLEDPPVYGSRTPQNAIFFQTRALPYFHHPAIFSFYRDHERV